MKLHHESSFKMVLLVLLVVLGGSSKLYTLQRVAALLADGHVAQVALPAGQALGLSLVVTHVVGVFALHCWQLACLWEEGSMVVGWWFSA